MVEFYDIQKEENKNIRAYLVSRIEHLQEKHLIGFERCPETKGRLEELKTLLARLNSIEGLRD